MIYNDGAGLFEPTKWSHRLTSLYINVNFRSESPSNSITSLAFVRIKVNISLFWCLVINFWSFQYARFSIFQYKGATLRKLLITPYLRTIFKNLLGGSPINLLINDIEPQYNSVLVTSVSILLYIDQNFYHDYRDLYLGF